MAIVFAARGDSLNARFSRSGDIGTPFDQGASVPASEVDASALSGSVINTFADTQLGFVAWPGRKNFSTNKAFSILFRIKSHFTGTVSTTLGLGFHGSDAMSFKTLRVFYDSSGRLRVIIPTQSDAVAANFTSTHTASFTTDDYHDIVLATDGISGNNLEYWFDGVNVENFVIGTEWDFEDVIEGFLTTLSIGSYISGSRGFGKYDEVVHWDEKINPASVGLVGGTGSLNGDARTALVDVAVFDALSNTFPTAAQIQAGVSFVDAGVGGTGTLDTIELVTDAVEADIVGGVLTGDLI